jgi:hypothetical protein
MKKILILLVVASSLAFSQTTLIGGAVRSFYLKGTPAAGVTYTNSTFDSSGTFQFGNLSRLALRLVTNDSTFVVVSLWKKEQNSISATWAAVDSVTIHPTSGAAADTSWTLRSTAVDIPKGTGTLYQFQYRFSSTGNWATQATASSLRVWLNYVGH